MYKHTNYNVSVDKPVVGLDKASLDAVMAGDADGVAGCVMVADTDGVTVGETDDSLVSDTDASFVSDTDASFTSDTDADASTAALGETARVCTGTRSVDFAEESTSSDFTEDSTSLGSHVVGAIGFSDVVGVTGDSSHQSHSLLSRCVAIVFAGVAGA